MQRARRTDPYPWTREAVLATAAAVVMVWVLGVHLGRGVANLIAGAGWSWPGRGHLITSLPAVLAGDARAGLDDAPARAVAGSIAVHRWVGVVEVAATAAMVWAGLLIWWWWGPGRVRGMASRTETRALLGEHRLKAVAPIVRPDLHPRHDPPKPVPAVSVSHLRKEVTRRVAARRRLQDPGQVGWRLGTARHPRGGGALWVPYDRTAGVIGPQGSGKTLDVLVPALLQAPGAALVTLTKVDDLLLSFGARARGGRPVLGLEPFGLAEGLPELVWDPVLGRLDPLVAERRAKAFTAGTVHGAIAGGHTDDAARFYAAEAAKVLQAFFHAAALTGRDLEDVLRWVAHPAAAFAPAEILREHPQAAPFWHGLLTGALHGDDRTAGNTTTTVQQSMALFFQDSYRRRCTPGPGRPATDIASVIARGGTIYLMGRDDPYASASPLLTAVAETILDAGLAAANTSRWGRLCPPLLACLDELPSTAPLPTLRTRMANERALGTSFIWSAQTRAQLSAIFGEVEARNVIGLTNNLIMFGGSKDVAFNQELSDLIGQVRVPRTSWQTGSMGGRTVAGDDIAVLTGPEIRELPDRQALVLSENGKPVIARLARSIDGEAGRALLAAQDAVRALLRTGEAAIPVRAQAAAALVEAHRRGLIEPTPDPHQEQW